MDIYAEIERERAYQREKWGNAFDDQNTVNDWSAYITRYSGNANYARTPAEWRQQMLKVATLAVAAIETFDRNGSLPPRHYDNDQRCGIGMIQD